MQIELKAHVLLLGDRHPAILLCHVWGAIEIDRQRMGVLRFAAIANREKNRGKTTCDSERGDVNET